MSYLTDYLFYASENEASPKFHKWACLMTLACAVTRRVWIKQGDWKVYPNMYLGFVGDPASGKSVAMGFCERLVQDGIDVPIGPSAVTKEALTRYMSEECRKDYTHDGQVFSYTPIALFANELVTLLGTEPQRMIDWMTDIYDVEGTWKNATKNQGKDSLERPCVNLLGCITPNTLESMVVGKLVSGGFTRRMIPVFSNVRGRAIPRPSFGEEHKKAKLRCTTYAQSLAKLTGAFAWTPAAEEWFDSWYINVKDKQMRAETNPAMRRYYAAKDVLLLKVAMLLSLAAAPQLILDVDSLRTALEWLNEVEPDMLTVWGGGGRNELAPLTFEIERAIREAGPNGVSGKTIKARFVRDAKDSEIALILNHLVETEAITRDSRQPSAGLLIELYRHRDHAATVVLPPQQS